MPRIRDADPPSGAEKRRSENNLGLAREGGSRERIGARWLRAGVREGPDGRRQWKRKSGLRVCVRREARAAEEDAHRVHTYTLPSSHFGGIMARLPEFTGCSITQELSLSQCGTTYLRLPSPAGRESTVGRDRQHSQQTLIIIPALFPKILQQGLKNPTDHHSNPSTGKDSQVEDSCRRQMSATNEQTREQNRAAPGAVLPPEETRYVRRSDDFRRMPRRQRSQCVTIRETPPPSPPSNKLRPLEHGIFPKNDNITPPALTPAKGCCPPHWTPLTSGKHPPPPLGGSTTRALHGIAGRLARRKWTREERRGNSMFRRKAAEDLGVGLCPQGCHGGPVREGCPTVHIRRDQRAVAPE
ncbi:hypothetical protein KM043_015522 [Ampulex compressa]|nr:hypothetical protein KM043_015522 [Ampulex compressa]